MGGPGRRERCGTWAGSCRPPPPRRHARCKPRFASGGTTDGRDTVAPPLPFSAPRTSLGTRLGRRRTVGLAQVDRADVEAVRTTTGATFNDVILALAGAVLRSHLEDRGELPAKPMVAFVPVSVRSDDDKLDTGGEPPVGHAREPGHHR